MFLICYNMLFVIVALIHAVYGSKTTFKVLNDGNYIGVDSEKYPLTGLIHQQFVENWTQI